MRLWSLQKKYMELDAEERGFTQNLITSIYSFRVRPRSSASQ